MKTWKKTIIMIVLTFLCIVLIDNYNRQKDEEKLLVSENEETIGMDTGDNIEDQGPSYYVTLTALGQNCMNDSMIESGLMEDGTYNYDFMFSGVESYLQSSDIAILCQGSVLGGNDQGVSGYPTFNAPEEFADAAVKAGINAVAMANVRVNALGSAAITNSIAIWKNKMPDMSVLGLNESPEDSNIAIVEKNGLKIALLDYTAIITNALGNQDSYLVDFFGTYENGVANFSSLSEKTLAEIDMANKTSDFVVVVASWGLEDTHEITNTQSNLAKQLTEAGVDLIIGNRTNYMQKVEWVISDNGNRALCYYSLGNFGSSENTANAILGGIARVGIKVENGLTVIDEEHTGIIPVVSDYTYPGTGDYVDVRGIVPLSAFTSEQAAEHGLVTRYGGALTLDVLQGIVSANIDSSLLYE